jgi:hypothetical protein
MPDHRERREQASLFERMAGAAVSTIPLAGPFMSPFAERLGARLTEEWARNTSRALLAAERVSGMSREDLAEAIEADERLIPLFTRVLIQAGMSGHEEKLRALGAGLGWAIREPKKIDSAEMLLVAIQDIGAPHIQVLEMITQPPPPFSAETPDDHAWSGHNIPEQADLQPDFGRLVLSGLLNAGLVIKVETYDFAGRYQPSDLGRVLLDVLKTLNEQDDSRT